MKALLCYRLRDNLKSAYISIVIVIGIFMLLAVSHVSGKSNSSVSIVGVIWALTLGIVTPRIDLRLGNQMGVGHRSAFWGSLLGNVLSFAIAAVGLTALTALAQILTNGKETFQVVELYQVIFAPDVYVLTMGQYAGMAVLSFAAILCAGFSGMLCTLLYWRLGKLGKVVLSVAGGAALLVGLPGFGHLFAEKLSHLMQMLLSSVWVTTAFLLVLAAILLLGTWLLYRRAPVTAPGK